MPCVCIVKREHLLDRRGVWQIVWVHYGQNKIGTVSRMVVYLVYFSCGDERFLVCQLGALCRSTLTDQCATHQPDMIYNHVFHYQRSF
jgi:hypothetical protein